MDPQSQSCYEFGPFRLNPAERLLLRDNEVVPITPKAFLLLLVLVERNGHLISKDELMKAVWPDAFVEEANLSRHVFSLRKALDEEASGVSYVETVPTRGYRFVADVKQRWDEPDDLIAEERTRPGVIIEQQEETSVPAEVHSQKQVSRLSERRWMIAGSVALAALVIGAVAALSYVNRRPVLTERDSIMLADFVNTTGDAVFDDTLKQALAAKLEESPFLNIFSEQQARETLRLMRHSPDERVTQDIAREICQRQGIKALVAGEIAKLVDHYAITLEAINGETGETIAREVVEADDKDQVLKAVGGAAAKLREKLGESLVSIQKFDAPIAQATTSSLEALRAFSQGNQYQLQGRYREAVRFYQSATELDPDFALAYARLSAASFNLGQQEQASKYSEKAFELRERVSQREKFVISSYYHLSFTRDFDELVRVTELFKTAYPREAFPHVVRGVSYAVMGEPEKAIEEYQEAIRLNPDSYQASHNLAAALLNLNRFEEAKHPSKIEPGPSVLYQIAFIEGDTAEMKRQLDLLIKKDLEHIALGYAANVAVFSGRLREAQELTRRAIDLSKRRNLQGEVEPIISGFALQSATLGQCQSAGEALDRISTVQQNLHSFFNIGMARAVCGEFKQVESMIDERFRQYPKDRVANETLVPLIQAAVEIQRGNRARAIKLLEDVSRYKSAVEYSGCYQSYLLGQAFLSNRQGAEAAVQFQYILDHRGNGAISVLYPLAYLGLARAAGLTGDTATSQRAYQDFFELWKVADNDIPILIATKKEYQKLKRVSV